MIEAAFICAAAAAQAHIQSNAYTPTTGSLAPHSHSPSALQARAFGYDNRFDQTRPTQAYRCTWCRLRLTAEQVKCNGCGAPT